MELWNRDLWLKFKVLTLIKWNSCMRMCIFTTKTKLLFKIKLSFNLSVMCLPERKSNKLHLNLIKLDSKVLPMEKLVFAACLEDKEPDLALIIPKACLTSNLNSTLLCLSFSQGNWFVWDNWQSKSTLKLSSQLITWSSGTLWQVIWTTARS